MNIFIIIVVTLTLDLQLSGECKGPWGQENVFECETHFLTIGGGGVQGMEPNDPQRCSHFGNCTCVKVLNVQSFGWKGEQALVLKCRCLKCFCIAHLDLICVNYDQKKGREPNRNFDFWPQIPLKQGLNEFWLGRVIHHWKDILRAIL